jgi:hypothetical protein
MKNYCETIFAKYYARLCVRARTNQLQNVSLTHMYRNAENLYPRQFIFYKLGD